MSTGSASSAATQTRAVRVRVCSGESRNLWERENSVAEVCVCNTNSTPGESALMLAGSRLLALGARSRCWQSVLQQRNGISAGLASAVSSSRKAIQTRPVREAKQRRLTYPRRSQPKRPCKAKGRVLSKQAPPQLQLKHNPGKAALLREPASHQSGRLGGAVMPPVATHAGVAHLSSSITPEATFPPPWRSLACWQRPRRPLWLTAKLRHLSL